MKEEKRFLIMGVLNVTPDSFSDGGLFLSTKKAVEQAHNFVEAGADYIDIGAESTRPGSSPVSQQEEWSRLSPVLKSLSNITSHVKLSIDTTKPEIMLRCLDLGFSLINDVGGLRDETTLEKINSYNSEYIAMHCLFPSKVMQSHLLSVEKTLESVDSFFESSYKTLRRCGFAHDKIWLDPGIGFGKSDTSNLNLLAKTADYAKSYQVAIGTSRKSWLGRLLDIKEPVNRDIPSKMIELGISFLGCRLIRTHDVAGLKRLRDCLDLK